MVRRPFPAIALAVLMLGGLAGPAWCQATTAAAAASRDLDPGRSTGPDPLTPPEVDRPPPAAPGVPTAPTETAKPASEIDPIVALVRQRLAAAPPLANAGDRDDRAGLVAFYAEHTGANWVSKTHIDCVGRDFDIWFDNEQVMERGKFLVLVIICRMPSKIHGRITSPVLNETPASDS
jgi:hypothetical protein